MRSRRSTRYAWPLNVRELERALAAALAVASDRIELPHLPAAVREPALPPAPAAALPTTTTSSASRARARRSRRHDGNLAAVARELGKDRTQIRRWMKRFGLARGDSED